MALLSGFRVVQIGDGLAAAVAGRLFADAGAEVATIGAAPATALAAYLDHGKVQAGASALAAADLIGARSEWTPSRPTAHRPTCTALRR